MIDLRWDDNALVSIDQHASTARRPATTGRWILRGTLIALAICAAVVLIGGYRQTQTASEVVEQVHAIALTRPDGGLVGPWWVSAKAVDPVGRLLSFRVEVGTVHFAAQTARVVVDPERDAFSFEMAGVVLIRVDEPKAGENPNRPLVEMERYVLGPIPHKHDIVR